MAPLVWSQCFDAQGRWRAWNGSTKEFIKEILRHLTPLIYLVEIQGVDFVEFIPKVRCFRHWEQQSYLHGHSALSCASSHQRAAILVGTRSDFVPEPGCADILLPRPIPSSTLRNADVYARGGSVGPSVNRSTLHGHVAYG